jgi:hypothetical protein
MQILPATITNGTALSNAIATDISWPIIGLEVPTIDTATVYLQGSSTMGGTYRRVLKTDGSGDWNIASTVGNKYIFIDQLAAFPFLKIETSINQTADRVFNFIIRTP